MQYTGHRGQGTGDRDVKSCDASNQKWRVCDSVWYIHIDDPVAVLRSEQNEPAKKVDRGAETPVEARNIRGQPEGLCITLVYDQTNPKWLRC